MQDSLRPESIIDKYPIGYVLFVLLILGGVAGLMKRTTTLFYRMARRESTGSLFSLVLLGREWRGRRNSSRGGR
jgi:hypothetical protein